MSTSAVAIMTFNRRGVIETSLPLVTKYAPPETPVAVFEDAGYFDDSEGFLTRDAVIDHANPDFDREIEATHWHSQFDDHLDIFMGTRNLGVAGNSNRALHWFLTRTNADHLCLCNDDILPQGDFVSIYREAHRKLEVGLLCLMPFDDSNTYRPNIVVYRGQRIKLCPRMTGMMMSITRECAEDVGYFDMTFKKWGQEHSTPAGSRVWMGDYTFSNIENVKIGDKVIGWTRREKPVVKSTVKPPRNVGKPHNTLCRSTVIGVKNYIANNMVRVTMESGRVFECTADHWWWNHRFQGGAYARSGKQKRWSKSVCPQDIPFVHAVEGATLVQVIDVSKEPLAFTHDFKRGYLQGAMDGDGTYNSFPVIRVTDKDFSDRFAEYARIFFKVSTGPWKYKVTYDGPFFGTYRTGYYVSLLGAGVRNALKTWKPENDEQWRGWLSGMYDAEGSWMSFGQDRDINSDVYKKLEEGLLRFGFQFRRTKKEIVIKGGRKEGTRMFCLLQPKCAYKMDHIFLAGNFRTKDKVTKVEPIASARVYCLTTSTGNYVVHGYASKNCDWTNRARFMGHISLDNQPQGQIDIVQDCVTFQEAESSMTGKVRENENVLAEIALAKVVARYRTEGTYKPFATERPDFVGTYTQEAGIDYGAIKDAYTLVSARVPFLN